MGRVKIGAILPLRLDPLKDMLPEVLEQLNDRCDHVFVLHDRARTKLPWPVTEEVTIAGPGPWNDWVNRLTLMARAIKYGCQFVVQNDSDEIVGPTLTRKRLVQLCEQSLAENIAEVIVNVRTAWTRTHWRTDGIYGQQVKSFILRNPFDVSPIDFEWGPDKRLHHFPNLKGTKLRVDDYIIHHGLCTPEMRERNVAKYSAADKDNAFSCVRYDYLLNEQGITLEPL